MKLFLEYNTLSCRPIQDVAAAPVSTKKGYKN